MPTLTPEQPKFDREADYKNTLAWLALAFAAGERDGTVFDAGHGVRLLAGNMMATESLSYVDNATTLHLVVVESVGDDTTTYRYQLRHYDKKGLPMGGDCTNFFFTKYSDRHLRAHTEEEGEHVRGWLDVVQFDLWEAMAVAPDQVHTDRVDVVFSEETHVDNAKDAVRRARVARWLGWLGPLNPWRYKK